MSGISATPVIYRAKLALHDAIVTALAEDQAVDIRYGAREDYVANRDWIAMLGGRSDLDPKNIGPRRQQDEQLQLDVEIGVWSPLASDEGELAAQGRAFELLERIVEHIRKNDITLGGTVLWCVPGVVEFDGATADEDAEWGCLCIIAVQFAASHRVR